LTADALQFEWDDDKAAANVANHGVSFLTAAEIFANEIIERIDDREGGGRNAVEAIMAETKRIEIIAQLVYEDPDLALGWLETAFGLQTRMVVRDDAQRLVYAEIGLGDSAVGIGPERPLVRSPRNAGGATQSLLVRLFEDIDAHCAQARAGGATIVREPERFFFGDRSYDATDHEGHLWSFNQRLADGGDAPPLGWSVTYPSEPS